MGQNLPSLELVTVNFEEKNQVLPIEKIISVSCTSKGYILLQHLIKAAKYEIQKPSTCHTTPFHCKFSSMFLVFHLA